MTKHELKVWPQFFVHLFSTVKGFELRKDDRNFQVGDYVNLREWDRVTKEYSGRECHAQVTYKLRDCEGLAPDYCVLGLFVFHCRTTHAEVVEDLE